ncbi:MAG: hypothetical protein M3178_03940 [Pseudomonadota bacterium]|nr:hypothetical protein [Pseudomonadota bacterium]
MIKAGFLREDEREGLRITPLLAAGACNALAKGITIDIDEKMLPLSRVRLTGNLSCYWVPDSTGRSTPGGRKVLAAEDIAAGGRHQSQDR